MAPTADEVRSANQASIRAAVMYACALDAYSWGYLAAPAIPPFEAVEMLAIEAGVRKVTSRQLRRQARAAKRAVGRLDLPEQIW